MLKYKTKKICIISYDKNCKMKTKINKDNSYSWIRRLTIVELSNFPNLIFRFNTIPIDIPVRNLGNAGKLILKLLWRGKRLVIAKTILNKNKARGLRLLDFMTTIIMTVSQWQKNRSIELWKNDRKHQNRATETVS
jgi:hypothetical protein